MHISKSELIYQGSLHVPENLLYNKENDKAERWLSSGQMLCEQLLCPNGGIKRTRTFYAGPSLITVHLEN